MSAQPGAAAPRRAASLRRKLLIGGAGLALFGAVAGAVGVWQAARATAQVTTTQVLQQQLELQRDQHRQAVQREVMHRLAGLRLLAGQRGTIDALKQFKAALQTMNARPAGDLDAAAAVAPMDEEMQAWLAQQFQPEWRRHNLAPLPPPITLLGQRSPLTAELQQDFIVRNPQPPGHKHHLVYPDAPTPYGQAHALHQRAFDKARTQLAVQDLLLIDTETDRIVYSVAKDLDFAVGLQDTPLAGTPLAAVYAQVRRAKSADALALSDAAAYLPAANRIVVFAAVPLYEGDQQIGVLAWRAGIEDLTAPLAQATASAGDTYLVGADKRLRSDPLALRADKAGFLARHGSGLNEADRQLVLHRGSGVGQLPLDSPAANAALAGHTGTLVQPHIGAPVPAAYAPLQLEGLRWAVITAARQAAAAPPLLPSQLGPVALAALLCLLTGALVGAFGLHGVLRRLAALRAALARVEGGDLKVRTRMAPDDEVGALGHRLDRVLDTRVAPLAVAARQHDAQGDAAVHLLQTLFQMANKDLSVRAAESADQIGSLAAAINQLGDDMSATLAEVRQVARRLHEASVSGRQQAARVSAATQDQRAALQALAGLLQRAADQVAQMALLSTRSREAATQTANAAEAAWRAVDLAVEGSEALRGAGVELEKRFKRLAERSSDTTGAVNLITSIAERTRVLASNAAGPAAAAGSAGQGLAQVAEAVQQLADVSRDSARRVRVLVQAVQVETGDTLQSMNRLIAQIARQSEQARLAGTEMAASRETTHQLAALVQQIAAFSDPQTALARALRSSVDQLDRGSAQTLAASEQQTASTAQLVELARRLSEAVGPFKLPAPEED
ncbi:methyl-accepting chemotaxis protein [Caldimonas brevitalea]|uniref:Methyl-accepting chemotaxis protein n=1 Tax=Caldimonas brevitalea TaxID=413882 RepID=A0A0G3BZS3_9BURK|nr:methyl-accepting chemotaxis protein [Caldimonas brevitalea]AKJ32040.1 methyl-accepting chemotaxis protein [Caldimonas brevitalea]